jgi:hypothetical protein
MVFPSLAFNVEPGLMSQGSAFLVLAFAWVIRKSKRVLVIGLLMTLGVFFAYSKTHAMVMVNPQSYPSYGMPYSPTMNNFFNYYGRPWGYAPPVYFYPQLQYPAMMPMQQYYFNPHPPSPYGPGNYCPFCNQPQQPYPFPVVHPGGGIS